MRVVPSCLTVFFFFSAKVIIRKRKRELEYGCLNVSKFSGFPDCLLSLSVLLKRKSLAAEVRSRRKRDECNESGCAELKDNPANNLNKEKKKQKKKI
jgi:hypothetical protein